LQNNKLFELVKNNLYVGLVIKNYRFMCLLLNQEEKKGGRNKKLQFEQWQQYFNWEKQGQKFIITEIYEEPIIKIDNQGNNIYNVYIEKLMLDLLVQKYQTSNERRIYLSRDQMLQTLNMVNTNYHYIKYNAKDTANYIKVDADNIKEFYNINNRNLNNAVERTLDKLSNRFLVNWQFVQTVAVKEEEEEIYSWSKKEYKSKEIHRDATNEEREIILIYEKMIAEEMGFEKKSDIFLCGRYLEFTNRVCDRLQNNGINILYYYKSYDVVFHPDVIKELDKINQYLLEYEERKDVKITLNGIVSNQIEKNTKNRHEEAKEELPPVRFGKRRVDKYDYKQMELIRRSDDNYIIDTEKIADTVINHKMKNLVDSIITYNRKEKQKLEKDMDNLLYGDNE